METKALHTSTLEKLYGPVECEIIRQDHKIRVVHLKDKKGVSRTVGVVRFYNTDHKQIKHVHSRILAGGLLGKTLQQSKIKYTKEIIGALNVSLPDWIKKEFKTDKGESIAILSAIKVNAFSGVQFLYTEILEVLPPELSAEKAENIIPKQDIDKDLLPLFESIDIIIEN